MIGEADPAGLNAVAANQIKEGTVRLSGFGLPST